MRFDLGLLDKIDLTYDSSIKTFECSGFLSSDRVLDSFSCEYIWFNRIYSPNLHCN